jgi:hypothetical protein
MNKLNIVYWVSTGLFVLFIVSGSIGNVMLTDEWKTIAAQLKLPEYLFPFLGVAKILGCIALLAPISPRIKEWAYAGLFFDLIGAMYCGIAVASTFDPMILTMLVPFALMGLSYGAHHRRLELKGISI